MSTVKEFVRNDVVREVSSHNYLELEYIKNELKVQIEMCILALSVDVQTEETNELLCRGVQGLSDEIQGLELWLSCVSRGVDINP